ncbi:MAG: UDP-glucose 4-epimerase GalE [Clostridia bacterium]|nr:UDP-glucose 4-epimerase GalE [Clostridia bacterium]
MFMILVTGGTGYIGSHTVVELQSCGKEVVIIDNLSNSKREVVDAIETISGKRPIFIEGDICDEAVLTQVFETYPIDAVIHFAGLKAVGESVAKPLEYYTNNIVGTLTLVGVMRRFGTKKLVFSSSATVYGQNNPVPFTEDMPRSSTTNPYGESKVMQERILEDIAAADPTLSIALLRYFNPIGSHESGLIGDDPNGIPNNLMPYVCRVATGKLPILNIFGNDYPTPDGTCLRDYIHVVDLAKGHIAALDYLNTHTGTLTVNLGTGKGSSVIDIVKAFEKASGKPLPHQFAPRRAGDIAECYASTEKAKALLGWTATKTLDEMCRDSYLYAKTH